tara:strand:+ start:39 stop:1001 length:963 start_codon:yes stop_codon:yes gene_type:complete
MSIRNLLSPQYELMATMATPAINFGRGVLGFQDPVGTQMMKDRMLELESQKGTTGTIGYEDYGLQTTKPGGRFTGGLTDLALNNPVDFALAGSVGRYGFSPKGRTGLTYDFTPDQDTGTTGNALLDFINEGGIKGAISRFEMPDSFFGKAFAPELNLQERQAIADRTALDRQGLMALDDAGLTIPDYEEFAEVAKPGLNLGFAKQLGKQALTGILTAVNPIAGLIARGLSGMPGRVGIQGGVGLRGDTNLDTFARSTSFADFAQRMRDKRARETAAMRGSVKDLQSRIDRGDFGGNNNAGKDTSGASGGAPGGGADASTY